MRKMFFWRSYSSLSRTKKIFVAILIFANIFASYALFRESRAELLMVAVLDVGQGDGIFIETPNGNQVLIDAGATSEVLRSLGEVMPFYDRSIDLIIPTHPDLDHMGGFIPVLDRYLVSAELESGINTSKAFHQTFEKDLMNEGAMKIIARRGMRVWLDTNVVFDVLYPDRDVSNFTTTNDGGVVGVLTYGEARMLFTADIDKKVEDYLISLGDNLDAQVLKVAHHGSRYSSGEEFIVAVQPKIAVISSGKGNSYGHPHKDTLDTLTQAGAEVLDTQNEGTIVLISDGKEFAYKK